MPNENPGPLPAQEGATCCTRLTAEGLLDQAIKEAESRVIQLRTLKDSINWRLLNHVQEQCIFDLLCETVLQNR